MGRHGHICLHTTVCLAEQSSVRGDARAEGSFATWTAAALGCPHFTSTRLNVSID